MRRPITHPDWCARAHYCSAVPATRTLPARGEHRSEPFRLDTPWGGLVATLVAAVSGRAWLELRISVHIPEQENRARLRADLIAEHIGTAIGTATTQADLRLAARRDPTLAALLATTAKEVTR
jgi:hypothetical protein